MAKGKSRRVAAPKKHAGKNARMKGDEPKRKAAGSNFGEPSDESVKRHINWIDRAKKEYDKAALVAKTAKSALSNAYKSAKADRVDIDALKAAFEEADRPLNTMVTEMRNKARYLRLMGAELASEQLNLFPWLDEKAEKTEGEPRLAGEAAGKNGEPLSNNPHQPGSDAWAVWNVGHQIGVDALQESLGTGTMN